MLAVKDHPLCRATPVMPFIDFYMVQLTMVAKLPWQRFMDCISCPIAIDLRKLHPSARDVETYGNGFKIAMQNISEGAYILHSVKNAVAIRKLAAARADFLAGHPNLEPRKTPAPIVGHGGNPRLRGRTMRGSTGGPPSNHGLKA
jgi:hypothetical protein